MAPRGGINPSSPFPSRSLRPVAPCSLRHLWDGQRWWWRWALFSILTVTTLNVILTSSSYARVMTGPFGGSPRLEAVANRVASWLGWCPADAIVAVELTVDFSPQPGPQPSGSGALLASGTYPWNNSVGVGYPSENKVLFQAFRSFTIQRAVEVIMDRSVPHRVRIELGALLPPDRHPFWDGVPSFAIRRRREQIRILCDGVVILQGEVADFPPGSALPQIGSLRDTSGKLTNPFAGRILDVKLVRAAAP